MHPFMPLTPVTLRPVHPDDEAFLFEVYVGTRRDEVATWGWDAAQQEAFLRMQYIAQQRSYQMQCAEAEHCIILQGECPVGRLIVVRTDAEVRLANIALLPEYRNLGLGTTLIAGLQAEAARTGRAVRLQVLRHNRAQRLYERLGFVRVGEDALHFSMEHRPTALAEPK